MTLFILGFLSFVPICFLVFALLVQFHEWRTSREWRAERERFKDKK